MELVSLLLVSLSDDVIGSDDMFGRQFTRQILTGFRVLLFRPIGIHINWSYA